MQALLFWNDDTSLEMSLSAPDILVISFYGVSSVSSGINAIAAMVFSDFVKVYFPVAAKNKNVSISKAISR